MKVAVKISNRSQISLIQRVKSWLKRWWWNILY